MYIYVYIYIYIHIYTYILYIYIHKYRHKYRHIYIYSILTRFYCIFVSFQQNAQMSLRGRPEPLGVAKPDLSVTFQQRG